MVVGPQITIAKKYLNLVSWVRDHHTYLYICKFEILTGFLFGSCKGRPPNRQIFWIYGTLPLTQARAYHTAGNFYWTKISSI